MTQSRPPDPPGSPDPAAEGGPAAPPGSAGRRFRRGVDPWLMWWRTAERLAGHSVPVPAWLRKTPQQAAATAVLPAISPLLEAIGGRYFTDCNEARPVARRPGSPAEISKSVAAYALEPANADRLWETSLRLLA